MASSKFRLLPADPGDPRARTRTVAISGQKVKAVTNLADFGDEVEQPYHNIWRKGSKKEQDCTWVLEIETPNGKQRFHRMWERDERKRSVLFRDLGAVVVENGTGPRFAEIVALRRWPFLLLPALAALVLCLMLTFCGPVSDNAPSALGFLQGMAQTEGVKSEPVLSVEYASYASTPDSTLAADSLKQHLVLSLPANCKEGGNPIASAPSIYIDLNCNGAFEPDEIVYNPDGGLLKAGTEVSELEFTQPVPAGSYSALTRWDSVLSSDHLTPAGCATFKWVATFE